MSTFADFALLAAVPSYGGAEILRAQRVLPMGPGPRVHLALFGRQDVVMRRVVAAANAGAAILHPAIARIYEVARYDGVVYGVGDPSEGLDLSVLVAAGKPIPVDLALAITATLGRVAVAIHDAGGPGYRGPPLGLGAVLSGGLTLDTVFLEPQGAVRIRPLAAAGNDPDAPSTFRAPEGEVSMAADVYALGRVLMALMSGDPAGRTTPRLPPTSPIPPFLARLIHKRASERAHLHEVVTRLEALLREQGAVSADHVIRGALGGTWRSLVVDPGFALDAPPRVVDPLRMQLAYLYPAIERLWPTMTPSMAPPPPPAFAALPPSTSGEGNAVFTDARPVHRKKAKTAATVLFNPAEARGALPPAMSGEGGAFKPKTSPTLMFDKADLAKALPAPGHSAPADKTQMIDPSTFTPFAPPAAGPPRPPTLGSSPSPTPPPRRSEPGSPRPRAPLESSGVFATGGADDGDGDDKTQMLSAEDAMSILLVKRKGVADVADVAAIAAAFAGADDDDVFTVDGAFAPSAPPVATSVAPPPALSEPGGPTDAMMAVANASTALGASRTDRTESSGPPRHTRSDDDTGAFSSSSLEGPDSIADGAAFVMVGDAGESFEGAKNPFKVSTRVYPAQAMQKARTSSGDGDLDAVQDDDDAEGVFSQEGAASSTIPSDQDQDEDDVRTEMVSADHVASMLRGIEAARAPAPELSQEGDALPTQSFVRPDAPVTRQRPRPVSGITPEPRRAQASASVPDGGALSQLFIAAPEGATVSVNGTIVGTGPTTVDVAPTSRCVVKVSLPAHAPFSTVVMLQGRPRVRVKPVLKVR